MFLRRLLWILAYDINRVRRTMLGKFPASISVSSDGRHGFQAEFVAFPGQAGEDFARLRVGHFCLGVSLGHAQGEIGQKSFDLRAEYLELVLVSIPH
jgi:hypothetical protein